MMKESIFEGKLNWGLGNGANGPQPSPAQAASILSIAFCCPASPSSPLSNKHKDFFRKSLVSHRGRISKDKQRERERETDSELLQKQI